MWQQVVLAPLTTSCPTHSFDSLLAGDRWLAACTKWTLPSPKQRLVAAVLFPSTPKTHRSQDPLNQRFCARAHESRLLNRRRNRTNVHTKILLSLLRLHPSATATTKARGEK